MGRTARKESETGYYHVIQRGTGKQILFEDADDYNRYLDKLSECKEKIGIEIIAYCLMNNHTHLLIHAERLSDLTSTMKSLGTSYAAYYNVKYDHAGYVFQGRYLSEPINDDDYLYACVRYIHNNPVKAGFGHLDDYRWSSYNEYLGAKGLADTALVLSMFDNLEQFKTFSSLTDKKAFIDVDVPPATCNVGKEIIRIHFGNEFDKNMLVKQLCIQERNKIIKEMKQAGMNNHQIELVTGVSRRIVSRVY